LQAAIASDGGTALADFAEGRASSESSVTGLIADEENKRRAAVAANMALPGARAARAAAQAEATRMENERNIAVTNALKVEANRVAARYAATWYELCITHDELVGISNALPPSSPHEPTIMMSGTPLQVPAFNLPGVRGGSSEWLETMRHLPSALTVSSSQKRWTEARERLLADAGADVSDLIGADTEPAKAPNKNGAGADPYAALGRPRA